MCENHLTESGPGRWSGAVAWRSLGLATLCGLTGLWAVSPARSQLIVPGANGSDGPFQPTANYEVDLGAAANRGWDQPPEVLGHGVYDYEKWAVVYKYTYVNIPAGVTVTFKNHDSRAPVVWLVSGDVTIAGVVNLNGGAGASTGYSVAEPGPGGFRGGAGMPDWGSPGSAGFGPGGGILRNNGGSYCGGYGGYGTLGVVYSCLAGTEPPPAYGNAAIMPLIGGSGSSGYSSNAGGGGGAILIAAGGTITLSGGITALGGTSGYYPGVGGAIRLVANSVQGNGYLRAYSYSGGSVGVGRIRVEGNTIALSDGGIPQYTAAAPGATATLWPADTAPTVRVVSVGTQNVATDPRASLDFPHADVSLANAEPQFVTVETRNVPLNWSVVVRVVPRQGEDYTVQAYHQSGDQTQSTWWAVLTLPSGFAAVQARAFEPGAGRDENGGAPREPGGELEGASSKTGGGRDASTAAARVSARWPYGPWSRALGSPLRFEQPR